MKEEKSATRKRQSESVTLREVAERAGVHPMTVSRALKGSLSVAEETRLNIQRIAKELNYIPNAAAQALVRGRSETIAVVTGPVSEHYCAQLLHFLEIELTANAYKMLMLGSRDLNHDLLSLVNTKAVDGVIAVDASPHIDEWIRAGNLFVPPCVYAGISNPDWVVSLAIDSIHTDLSEAVGHAVEMMLNTGSRRIAYIVANQGMSRPNEVRAHAYEQTLKRAGYRPEIINLGIGDDTSAHDLTRQKMIQYVRAHGCADGFLCQNDEMAMATYRALRDMGLRIPEDVQLVGCDGLSYTECFDPQISTIVQPAEQMCALAWQFLQRRINDDSIARQQAHLQAHLRVRGSLRGAL